jgi:hypothetical protein
MANMDRGDVALHRMLSTVVKTYQPPKSVVHTSHRRVCLEASHFVLYSVVHTATIPRSQY